MSTAFPRHHPVWTAPLIPVALALTVGIVADRFWIIPLSASLCLALFSLLAWLLCIHFAQPRLALAYLGCCVAASGAAYYHWQRYSLDANDISHFADRDGQPTRLRGTLASAPIAQPGQPAAPLRTFPTKDSTKFILRVTQQQDLAAYRWQEVSGLVQVTVRSQTQPIGVGDEVEVLGRLALPADAANPGGFDYASSLRDQGITATLTVVESDEVILLRRRWSLSPFGWLAALRGWGQQSLANHLSAQQTVAAALLLGEDSGMTRDDWDKYQRTGVIHVLAISGQHLVVLATFLWYAAWLVGIRRRRAALVVALLLLAYGLLTGGRPPVMRSVWVILAYCGGMLLQRPVARANTFALAWIIVALVNPADLFNAGCQLSFLAVAILIWGVGSWPTKPPDPLQEAIDEARPWYEKTARWLLRFLGANYAINAAVSLAVTPLIAAHFHMVTPVALLLGPPMVWLTSLALLSGFAFLLFAAWCAPLAWLFAFATQFFLAGCDLLVSLGLWLPGAYWYIADVPIWWLWIFYPGLLVALTLPIVWQHGRWAALTVGVWLLFGVLLMVQPHRPGEFRCSFVAVGHGGCTVIETPSGHVSVYDAGATTGPEVTRRHIAPFLWSRGIQRIDDVILSHADLDHFNGLVDLAERFPIGRVVCTPSFAERNLPGMKETLTALHRRGIPMHVVQAGQSWQVDGVSFVVLHPPAVGPAGKENARSLVLRVKYADCALLLTGDLEEAGMTRVLELKPPKIDLLMAPHHGSDKSNIPALAAWANPRCVVSCQTVPMNERQCEKMYEKLGVPFLGTWPHGTVTLRHDGQYASMETYRTRLVWRLFARD